MFLMMTRWECKVNTDHLRVDCALQNSVTVWLEITCFEYIANNLPILSVKTNLTVFFWLCWRKFWFFSFLLSNLKCLQKWLMIKSTKSCMIHHLQQCVESWLRELWLFDSLISLTILMLQLMMKWRVLWSHHRLSQEDQQKQFSCWCCFFWMEV